MGKREFPSTRLCALSAILGSSERFWLGLQADYDLEEAHRTLGRKLTRLHGLMA